MREVKIITVSAGELHGDVDEIINGALMARYEDAVAFSHRPVSYLDKIAQNLNAADDPQICEIVIIEQGTKRSRTAPQSQNPLADALDCLADIDEDNGWVSPILIADTIDELSRPRLDGLPVRVVPRGQVEDFEVYLDNIERQIRRVIRGKFGKVGAMLTEPADEVTGPVDELVACIELAFVENTPTYQVRFYSDMNKEVPQPMPLGCDPRKIRDFLQRSAELDDEISSPDASSADMVKGVNAIGDLSLKLFENGNFQRDYGEALTRCEKMQANHNRVRFKITTSPDHFPGMYEAIRMQRDARPVSVVHPTTRTVPFDIHKPTLKWDRKDPVNILVVNANMRPKEGPYEFANIPGARGAVRIALPELRNVEAEVAMFRTLGEVREGDLFKLDEASTHEYRLGCPVNKVTILDRGSTDGNLLAAIKRELTTRTSVKERFDILHFAGHACDIGPYVDAPDGDIVLALPSADSGAALGLSLAELTGWLTESQIQMVYLSCCAATPGRGGAAVAGNTAAVAQLMAQSQVPVTLGFRWNIDDKKAFEFAASFYGNLLSNAHGFDDALQQARRDLWATRSSRDPVWAAPVLLEHAREQLAG